MSDRNLEAIQASIEQLGLEDRVRLLQFLAPKIADAISARPPVPSADAAQAWRHFNELGNRLAATSVPGAPSLTEAVSQMRR